MYTRTRGSENGQRVYSVWLAFLWKAGGRKKRVRMRAWEGVLAGRPYVWRAVCVKIIALLMWIWIKFYPCPHRPDARRLCQNYSAIHVDMDKIGFIHIHTDKVRAVCVKIIALQIWIWIKFYPCPHRREARRSCQNSQNGGCANTSSGTRLGDFICFYFRIFRTRRLSYENFMRRLTNLKLARTN